MVLFWKEDFDLEIETFSKNHINTTINKNKEDEWRFIGLYGELETQKRHEPWDRLWSLKNKGVAPWICVRDFNEITKQSKKGGRRVKPHHQMQLFHKVLGECGFMDMGFVGSLFTWHKHYPNYTVWERLDRAVATNQWFAKFLETKIHHLDMTTLNHKALWMVPKVMECRQQR